jgi:hypothetical protein
MITGDHKGERLGACTDCRRFWARFRAGEIDAPEMKAIESKLAPSAGTCMVMGTASTMACVTEAMGMMLPGGACIPAVMSERLRNAEATGARAVAIAKEKLTPDRIMTPDAFENGLRMLLADLENMLGRPGGNVVTTAAAATAPTNPAEHLDAANERGRPYDTTDLPGRVASTGPGTRSRRMLWALSGALLLAGAVAYIGQSSRQPATPPAKSAAESAAPRPERSLPPSDPAPMRETVMMPIAPQAPAAAEPASRPQANSVPPARVENESRTSGVASRTLSGEEIDLLRKMAGDFMAAGDFAGARGVLERAAEAGDASSAFALAATYDSAALARFKVKGLVSDNTKAAYWYERARDLGSPEAPQRLKALARSN